MSGVNSNRVIIVFDTETTGFDPVLNEIVQLSYILYDTESQTVLYATQLGNDIVNINGNIPKETSDVHGITKDMTLDKRPIKAHIDEFMMHCERAHQYVGHNISYDIKMIAGQIEKVIKDYPEEADKYRSFLAKFQMRGKYKLPEKAYCTMRESQDVCAKIKGSDKPKFEKLMEVHKLLFKQNVKGQLHNALVDISVTLRVFLKLTMDIDICQTVSKVDGVVKVVNNNDICSLINPEDVRDPIQTINYNGEIITALTPTDAGVKEEKIIVHTAKQLVSDIQSRGIQNVLSRRVAQAPSPSDSVCTSISICQSTYINEEKTDEECFKPVGHTEFCVVPKTGRPRKTRHTIKSKRSEASKMSKKFVNHLLKSVSKRLTKRMTKSRKVRPLGGSRTRATQKKQRRE